MLSGLVAIVTGGSSGIGEAIVRRFTREHATVVILDVDLDRAARVAPDTPQQTATCIRCDVAVEAEVAAAVATVIERFGRIDILVNNAGLPPQLAPLESVSEADWDRMMDVHGKGCFLCCKHVMPHMKTQRGGAIVNIASLGGVRGRPDRHTYIASKHAVVGLTKSIALEGIAHNVRVNAIAPGPIARPGDRKSFDEHTAAGGSAISFEVKPDAVAWAALFLAAPESMNITGVVLPVDAGILAGSLARGSLKFPER